MPDPNRGESRFALIDQAAAGSTTVVSGVAGRRIVVKAMALTMSAAGTLSIKSNATTISGVLALGANGVLVLPESESGWMETVAGDPLVFTSVTGKVTGVIVYELD